MASRKPVLREANQLLGPALEATLADLDPPQSDAALVAECRMLAGVLDRMGLAELRAMAGQTVPQYHRALVELEKRAAARRTEPTRRRNQVAEMRAFAITRNRHASGLP